MKEEPAPTVKDRKRTSEWIESSKEPPAKERKLSTEISEPYIPKNLPKPVILSPIKVVKPKSSESTDSSQSPSVAPSSSNSENSNASVTTVKSPDTNTSSSEEPYAKVKKKGHDSSVNVSTSKTVKNKNRLATPITTSLHSKPEVCEKLGESSKSDTCENSKEKINVPTEGKNDALSRTDLKNNSYKGNMNSKENGRVHLCEVDNFFKLNRTSNRNAKSKDLQKKDSKMSSKTKNFRRSTLSCRNNTIRRKPTSTLRKQKLQTNISSCRTRAQSNIQKFKV